MSMEFASYHTQRLLELEQGNMLGDSVYDSLQQHMKALNTTAKAVLRDADIYDGEWMEYQRSFAVAQRSTSNILTRAGRPPDDETFSSEVVFVAEYVQTVLSAYDALEASNSFARLSRDVCTNGIVVNNTQAIVYGSVMVTSWMRYHLKDDQLGSNVNDVAEQNAKNKQHRYVEHYKQEGLRAFRRLQLDRLVLEAYGESRQVARRQLLALNQSLGLAVTVNQKLQETVPLSTQEGRVYQVYWSTEREDQRFSALQVIEEVRTHCAQRI
ncbi:hypothetical protein EK21DRAFT_119119 [Setomelanomma holmii]|uniref:Uncharacterized protein n=1 Tax=Setomelanomma holmii TaxID=210430 RepID=A0A9P4GW49_9PLEO|nr:hypothetical protein EK21DRAFT_119119 [Setomelanomma holmii]